MYSTCLFCNGDLGANEVLESFPVGRRLAFDAAKGRLWVLCLACGRWNLSPLEERWEAIEACERAFHDTRLRVSTDNIGMARLREGLELVRIGAPRRPEFAAWRYGEQFGRRRREMLVKVGAAAALGGAVVLGGLATGAVSIGALWVYQSWGARAVASLYQRRVIARLPAPDGGVLTVRQRHLQSSRIEKDDRGEGWKLVVAHDEFRGAGRKAAERLWTQIDGPPAVRAAGVLLAGANPFGATPREVSSAVDMIERAGDPARYVAFAARVAEREKVRQLTMLPYEVRLALEMAAHEETERRAMEGELAMLHQAWREAEEIAAIADDLLPAPGALDFVRRLRGREPG